MMIHRFTALIAVMFMASGTNVWADADGKALFSRHCAACHRDGGNIVNPKKTLDKKSREASNIKTEADIVKVMRNPGPGMNKFDVKTLTDKQAQSIAGYIVNTFK